MAFTEENKNGETRKRFIRNGMAKSSAKPSATNNKANLMISDDEFGEICATNISKFKTL
jgi:hypothetical protein